jgi:hypothetical protein
LQIEAWPLQVQSRGNPSGEDQEEKDFCQRIMRKDQAEAKDGKGDKPAASLNPLFKMVNRSSTKKSSPIIWRLSAIISVKKVDCATNIKGRYEAEFLADVGLPGR